MTMGIVNYHNDEENAKVAIFVAGRLGVLILKGLGVAIEDKQTAFPLFSGNKPVF